VTLDQKLETAVLVTLWIEFFYDLLWNNREARLKRRRNEKAKKGSEMDKQRLREGKGNLVQETKGEVRDMPETAIPIQKTTESGSQP